MLPDHNDIDASKKELHDLECIFNDKFAIFIENDEKDDRENILMIENLTTSSSAAPTAVIKSVHKMTTNTPEMQCMPAKPHKKDDKFKGLCYFKRVRYENDQYSSSDSSSSSEDNDYKR